MNKKILLIFAIFIAVLTLVLVSAQEIASNIAVKVNNELVENETVAVFAGESLDISVTFKAVVDEQDVRVSAWIDGYRKKIEDETERFDVITDRTYTKRLKLELPSDMKATDEYSLVVRVASNDKADEAEYKLTLQRQSYRLEILSVEYVREVKAGDNLGVNVVVKNRGSHNIDDIYVEARIPELGLEKRVYAGDLAPYDCKDNCSKEDAVEKTVLLAIPSDVKSGTYKLEIEASDEDESAIVEKSVNVKGKETAKGGIEVLTPQTLADIQTGKIGEYTLTLLNLGNEPQTVTISTGISPAGLKVTANPPILVIPANEAKDVKIKVETAETTQTGRYTVPLSITGENNEPVKEVGITANVIKAPTTKGGASTLGIITFVLVIIFVVLAVTLVTTLRRKKTGMGTPAEEIGETGTVGEETAYY